jgi:hypothetical protein
METDGVVGHGTQGRSEGKICRSRCSASLMRRTIRYPPSQSLPTRARCGGNYDLTPVPEQREAGKRAREDCLPRSRVW